MTAFISTIVKFSFEDVFNWFLFAAITLLKDKPPGTFVVRDSQSYKGAFGLAVKVATPPLGVIQQAGGDISKASIITFHCFIKDYSEF